MTTPIQILLPELPPPARLAQWCVAVGQQVMAGEVIAKIDAGESTIEVESTVSGRIERILIPENAEGIPANVAIALISPDERPGIEQETADGDLWQPFRPPARPVGTPRAASSPAPDPKRNEPPKPRFIPRSRRQLIAPRARGVAANIAAGPHGPGLARGAPELRTLTPHAQDKAAHAASLEEAARNIPCARLTIDCAIGALNRLRREYEARSSGDALLLPVATSPGIVFTKALGIALADIPAANVTWTPEGLLHHRSADVAFAVLLPELQISPVIRSVDRRSLDDIARDVIDLTQRARAKVIGAAELEGAAAAILDLGAYGVRAFEPPLEPPHSLSLSLGSKELRPVIIDGEIRSAPIITCTLVCDARAIPAAVAAELLATIKALVEEPVGLLLPAPPSPLF